MKCSPIENYVVDPNMEKWLREIITVKGKGTIPPKEYDEIVKRLCFALSFFGEYGREALRKKEFSLLFGRSEYNLLKGKFSGNGNVITIRNVLQNKKLTIGHSPSSLGKGSIEDVFVHEFAHFIDYQKGKLSKNTFISLVPFSRERQIAEAFFAKMSWKEKQLNSCYAVRTCELFARAIVEYWGILNGTEDVYIRVHSDNYYKYKSKMGVCVFDKTWEEYANYRSDCSLGCLYVERDIFLKHIAPLVADYMKGIQEGTLS